MAPVKLYAAPIPPDQISSLLTSKLYPELPYSLPLYRRCQFHLMGISGGQFATTKPGQPEVWVAFTSNDAEGLNNTLHRSPLEQISDASDSDRLLSWLSSSSVSHAHEENNPKEWLAALISLVNPGETQVWTFASWESTSPPRGPDDPIEDDPRTPTRIALFRALLERLRTHHIPALPDNPPQSWLTLLQSGKLVSEPYRRTKVLFGGIVESLWPYLQDDIVHGTTTPIISSAVPANTTCIARQDKPYLHYIIPLDESHTLPRTSSIPHGLHFGPLSDAHLQLMIDRTVIPRTLTLMKTLVSVGLFTDHETEPVAWGILSKEATVASLHTEPDFRGKGLAEVVSRELIRLIPETYHSRYLEVTSAGESADEREGNPIPYAHADVSPSNKASRRVFEKLGGTVRWRNAWIEVDLEKPSS